MTRYPRRILCLTVIAALAACEAMLPVVGGLLSVAASNFNRQGLDYDGMLEEAVGVLKNRIGRVAHEPAAAPPLELEVALLQQIQRGDEIVVRPIEEGDVLYYRGDLQSSDKFKIFLRPSDDCYIYVLSLDSTGWLQVLFPPDGIGKKVAAGTELFLPPSPDIDMSYAVDQYPGLETLYFIASRERNEELERALAPFIGLQRPSVDDPEPVRDLGEAYVERGVAARGAGGRASVSSRSGPIEFDTTVLRKAAGSDLVLTRTFYHEIER